MIKICPMNKNLECGPRCPCLCLWTSKSGEKFLSCSRLHARIVLEDIDLNGVIGPSEANDKPGSV